VPLMHVFTQSLAGVISQPEARDSGYLPFLNNDSTTLSSILTD